MDTYKKLTYGGVFGALVFLGTWILQIPIVFGYLNLGDGIILASALLLGPFAAVPAAIGSALADIAAGYAIYAPFTFVIKGLVALIPALLLKGKEITTRNLLLPFLLAELVMVLGYMIPDTLYFTFYGALAALPFNILQGVFGILLGLVAATAIRRNHLKRVE